MFAICAVCAGSDAILIAAGVAGFGAIVTAVPWLFARDAPYAGAAFLFAYALRSLWSAWHAGALNPSAYEHRSLGATILTCLALTWLNPHVYL